MSSSLHSSQKQLSHRYALSNPLPKHFVQIQQLCRKVYPFSKPWSLSQLESHRSYFPDGQLIVIDKETNTVVGLAFSLMITWNDYSPLDNWQDFTSGGYFHNHNPRQGKTLYGAEIMVDPEYRGQGIGKMLYQGRQKIMEKYHLKRIRAGARLRGYYKFKDQMTPKEYVKKVITGELFDPTLSFQLKNKFKVIDVAANYLFNDPESLGYAAVIEWLNPKENSPKEIERHLQSVQLFLDEDRFTPQFLPKELRRLVRKATSLLGQSILELEGEPLFKKIEYYREKLKKLRNKQHIKDPLNSLLANLSRESRLHRVKLTHAFSLQLEIVNVCEASYRTWRLRQKSPPQGLKNKLNLTYVLTAHPTEARSKMAIEVLDQIQRLLIEGIQNNFIFDEAALATQMRKLWIQPLSKNKKPSVMDEAEYIYSLVFDPDIFNFILRDQPGYQLMLRTWVGGDKDGHSGVNKDVMKQCLTKSREHILAFINTKLTHTINDLLTLSEAHKNWKNEIETLSMMQKELNTLKFLFAGDGTKIKTWTLKFHSFLKKASVFTQTHHQIFLIKKVIEFFPAFVLPIEMREDAYHIKNSLTDFREPIRGMLNEIAKIAGALDLISYVRGLVVSRCESSEDITNACQLIHLTSRSKTLRAIPLFESQDALSSSKKIIKNWLKDRKNQEWVQRHWGHRFEIMLGYSDSAKEIGVLPSRLLISRCMDDIDKLMKSFKIKPLFFHGAGGSVARGGGSLKEQISWWSPSAIAHPKMTIQGEMIQRTFATKEILNSHCAYMSIEALRRKSSQLKRERSETLEKFNSIIATEYSLLVNNRSLLSHLLAATPYRYLDILKIGSRPTTRQDNSYLTTASLRAIPWVLCWTQVRSLLPTWWGVGSAWQKLTAREKASLISLYHTDPFLSSFIKILGFTLAKVELDVWELYFSQDNNAPLFKQIRNEYKNAVQCVLDISKEKQLIWYRPWLEESIKLRSTHIHLLNLIQIIAMKNGDEDLMRDTIVGIACGMLTTG